MTILKAALVGGLLLLAGCKRAAPPPAPGGSNPHRDGLEFATSPLSAMYTAPEGKTPCETAFNAYQAGDDTAKAKGITSPFKRVAPHDEFLAACGKLTPAQQQCMGPKYKAGHEAECTPILPSVEVRNTMFEPTAK